MKGYHSVLCGTVLDKRCHCRKSLRSHITTLNFREMNEVAYLKAEKGEIFIKKWMKQLSFLMVCALILSACGEEVFGGEFSFEIKGTGNMILSV